MSNSTLLFVDFVVFLATENSRCCYRIHVIICSCSDIHKVCQFHRNKHKTIFTPLLHWELLFCKKRILTALLTRNRLSTSFNAQKKVAKFSTEISDGLMQFIVYEAEWIKIWVFVLSGELTDEFRDSPNMYLVYES